MALALLAAALAPAGCASVEGGSALVESESEVLGVPMHFRVRDPDRARAEGAILKALGEVERVGKLILADRHTSNFGVLNGIDPDTWIVFSEPSMRASIQALQIAAITGGAYSPARAVLLDLWGISDGEPRVPSGLQLMAGVQRASSMNLELNQRKRQARRIGAFTKLDLEGVAIGALVDKAAATLMRQGVPAAHVESGGISRVYTEEGGAPWPVDVMALDAAGRPQAIARVQMREGGFSTVFPRKVFHAEDGTLIHECIDPRKGRPVEGVNAAAVRAELAAVAAGLASAAFVLGDDTHEVLKNRVGLGWVLDTEANGRSHSPGMAPTWLVEESPRN